MIKADLQRTTWGNLRHIRGWTSQVFCMFYGCQPTTLCSWFRREWSLTAIHFSISSSHKFLVDYGLLFLHLPGHYIRGQEGQLSVWDLSPASGSQVSRTLDCFRPRCFCSFWVTAEEEGPKVKRVSAGTGFPGQRVTGVLFFSSFEEKIEEASPREAIQEVFQQHSLQDWHKSSSQCRPWQAFLSPFIKEGKETLTCKSAWWSFWFFSWI